MDRDDLEAILRLLDCTQGIMYYYPVEENEDDGSGAYLYGVGEECSAVERLGGEAFEVLHSITRWHDGPPLEEARPGLMLCKVIEDMQRAKVA